MTNNKQQTAVEWLISQLQKSKDWHRVLNDISQMSTAKIDILEQAKAMHKEEMVEFSQEVFRNRYNQVYQSLGNIADDIYNETFGGNNEQQ